MILDAKPGRQVEAKCRVAVIVGFHKNLFRPACKHTPHTFSQDSASQSKPAVVWMHTQRFDLPTWMPCLTKWVEPTDAECRQASIRRLDHQIQVGHVLRALQGAPSP